MEEGQRGSQELEKGEKDAREAGRWGEESRDVALPSLSLPGYPGRTVFRVQPRGTDLLTLAQIALLGAAKPPTRRALSSPYLDLEQDRAADEEAEWEKHKELVSVHFRRLDALVPNREVDERDEPR